MPLYILGPMGSYFWRMLGRSNDTDILNLLFTCGGLPLEQYYVNDCHVAFVIVTLENCLYTTERDEEWRFGNGGGGGGGEYYG